MYKIKEKHYQVTEGTILYNNGINCDYILRDGKLKEYRFYTKFPGEQKEVKLEYIDNIEELKKLPFHLHHTQLISPNLSLNEILNFTSFEHLYYIGGHIDGMIRDCKGNFISSLIHLDDTFFNIYFDINTFEQANAFKEKCKKVKEFRNIRITKIPYYNGGGTSIELDLMVSSKMLNAALKKFNKTFLLPKIEAYIIKELIEKYNVKSRKEKIHE